MEGIDFSDEQVNNLINQVYLGNITPSHLSASLYEATARKLHEGVNIGLDSIEWGGTDEVLSGLLKENIYYFSGAKTFQQTLEMNAALFNEDGSMRTPSEFKIVAKQIHVRYNGGTYDGVPHQGYIDTEYKTATLQAGNAKKWQQIEDVKHLFPYVRRIASEDELLCPICAPLHDILLPVGHPFWSKYAPASHFNCRCLLRQEAVTDGGKLTSDKEAHERATKANVPDTFQFNSGKSKEIYSTSGKSKHPYFEVPKEYSALAKRNFDLPM